MTKLGDINDQPLEGRRHVFDGMEFVETGEDRCPNNEWVLHYHWLTPCFIDYHSGTIHRILRPAGRVVNRPASHDDGAYWLTQKLDRAVGHLRDIEDYYRTSWEGLPERFVGSFHEARADRARSIYEQITSDFYEGKLGQPTMKQELDAAKEEIRSLDYLSKELASTRDQLTDSKNAGWAIAQARLKLINSFHEDLTRVRKINSEYHTLFHEQDELMTIVQQQVKVLTTMLKASGVSSGILDATLAAVTGV